jgi:restriction system protein
MLGMDELVAFNAESTAHWRRQTAERFPEDDRNIPAAERLERLAAELRALEGSALHRQVAHLAEADKDGDFSGILSELLRTVGFQWWPASGSEFLEELTSSLTPRSELADFRSVTGISSLVLQSVVTFEKKAEDGRLIASVTAPWFDIIDILKRDPNAAFEIPPEKWEEIIAGSYRKAGFEQVILTPRSGDLGRDVIAIKQGVGSIRVIDQVKAYKPNHLVSAHDVRALLGVVEADKASKGFLTTTSDFAPRLPTDRLLAPYIPSRLELINGKTLLARLAVLAKKPAP